MMAVGAQGRLSAALAVAEANADRAEQIERDAANAQLQFAKVEQRAGALIPLRECVNYSMSRLCVITVAWAFCTCLLLSFTSVHIEVFARHSLSHH